MSDVDYSINLSSGASRKIREWTTPTKRSESSTCACMYRT
jgi:hypothetical protein